MKHNLWNLVTTLVLGCIASEIIVHAPEFSQLVEGMQMRKYIVTIILDDERWGEYVIFAANPQTACFIAGLKYQREEQPIYPGTKITCQAKIPEVKLWMVGT